MTCIRRTRCPAAWLALVSGLAWLAAAGPAHAGKNFWTPIGPQGGDVRLVAVDPTDTNTIYAAPHVFGLFRSTDGSTSWSSAGSPVGSGIVHALAIAPTNPSTLYALSDTRNESESFIGVFQSTDSGQSWNVLDLGPGNVSVLIVDPAVPTTLYAGLETQGVFKSLDGGRSWNSVNAGLTSPYVRALAIDATIHTTLYTGTLDGLFKSTDGAVTWAAVNHGLPHETVVQAIVVDPMASNTVYIGTFFRGVFRSVNGGGSWEESNDALSESNVLDVTLDPAAPNTVYAIANTINGMDGAGPFPAKAFRSTDGGAHWDLLSVGHPANLVRALTVAAPRTLYAGTISRGVLKSTDGGTSWSPASDGLLGSSVSSLTAAPTTPPVLYAGVFGGVFKNGPEWIDASAGLSDIGVSTLAMSPSIPAVLYTIAGNDVFKSTNAGDGWVSTGAVPPPLVLVVDPTAANTLYVGTRRDGVFKSMDGGDTWSPASDGLPRKAGVAQLAIDPSMPATLYAGIAFTFPSSTPASLFKTTDGGATWMPASNGLDGVALYALAVDPVIRGALYAATEHGLFRSADAAATWRTANTGLPDSAFVSALAVDPIYPAVLYAGGTFGVFTSTNIGASWKPINTGFDANVAVTALALDPRRSSVLYAGTSARGVWTYTQRRQCAGDCNGDFEVTVNELVTGMNIALGSLPISTCPNFDRIGDNMVTIDELVFAVDNALSGCAPLQRLPDTCTDADDIEPQVFGGFGFDSTDLARIEVDEPTASCGCATNAHSVWLRFIPRRNGRATIDTFDSTFDSVLAAFSGSSCDALTEVTCNADFDGPGSLISFPVTAGALYFVQVTSQCGSAGGFLRGNVDLCGDGVVTGREECDDGNAGDDDGCDATCHFQGLGGVDQSWLGPVGICGTSGGEVNIRDIAPIGQEFTPTQPTLAAADVLLFQSDPILVAEGMFTLNIRDGAIDGPILSTVSVAASKPPGFFWQHFTLPSPIVVVPGQTYVLELTDPSGNFAWRAVVGTPDQTCTILEYAGGSGIARGTRTVSDFVFRTYSAASE